MAREIGSLGLSLSALLDRVPTSVIIAGALGLLGVAAAAVVQTPQVPLLMEPDSATQKSHSRISVMIVGDSITQGTEGDWTWRYRMWEWCRDQNLQVRYMIFFLSLALLRRI